MVMRPDRCIRLCLMVVDDVASFVLGWKDSERCDKIFESIHSGRYEDKLSEDANKLFPNVFAMSGKTDKVSRAGKKTTMLDAMEVT